MGKIFTIGFLLILPLANVWANPLSSVAALSQYCQQQAAAPFYAKPHHERFLEKIFLMSTQKIIMDELKKSFFYLAEKGPGNSEQGSGWETLLAKLKEDIRNVCKVSGTLFSANHFYQNLTTHHYQKNSDLFLSHSELLKNLSQEFIQKLHATNLSLARQVFRDVCSWNGLVSDGQNLSPYLDDPAIGLQVLKYLVLSPRPIICKDEGCSQVSRSEWTSLLPRPQEKKSVEQDIEDYWCANHFVKRYGIKSGMRWKVTLMGDIFLNHHDPFYLQALGIPMVKQWETKLKTSMDPWAKSELQKLVKRWPWEEQLILDIENFDSIFEKDLGMEIGVHYGEFDRNYQTFDKVFMPTHLKLNRPLLEWVLRFKYQQRDAVIKTLSLNINQQLVSMETQYHFLNYAKNLPQEMATWIVERIEQILSSKNKQNFEGAYVYMPVTFKTGLMALKLVQDRQL